MTRWMVLGLFAVGCAHAPTAASVAATGPAAADYYPLKVGTSWQYQVTLLGETRTIDVALERVTPEGFVVDSTGAQLMADAFGVRDAKRYLIRNPIEAGTKWTNVVSVSSVEHYEILATDQPCEAPAGSWQGCVVVESQNRVEQNKVLVNELTFAPSVGIVRLSTSLEANGQRIPQSTLVLLKYSPPAP